MKSTVEPIIVGYNDSNAARAALLWAIDYGHRVEAELVVMNVMSSVVELEYSAAQLISPETGPRCRNAARSVNSPLGYPALITA